jgi:tetratricopeptide (TPR) repeat protein
VSQRDPSSGPERLALSAPADPALARLGELAREIPRPPALPDAALERVFLRLSRPPARFWGLGPRRLVVVLAVLAVASVAVGRYALRVSRRSAPAVSVVPVPVRPVTAPALPKAPPGAHRAPSPLPAASVDGIVSPPVVARAPSATTVTTPESRLAAESKALEPAIAALRRERDAARALTLLGRYDAEFPHGVLSLEARVARIDALLALGRRTEALTLLDALPLDRVGRGTELRLVRAELHAASDCRSALADFDRVLSAAPSAGAEERALRGRSLCRRSLGDAAGARNDADRYLSKYPGGRFAEELRGGAR